MKAIKILLLLSACAAAEKAISNPSAATQTVTKTATKTVTVHTTIPTPSGWLPAKMTKNQQVDAKKQAKRQARPLDKAAIKKANSRMTTQTSTAASLTTTTVTKWASTTTVTVSAYAACKTADNFVQNGAADGTSGVDGACDCEAYVTTYAVAAVNAAQCCHICWEDPMCIGSAYTANDMYGQGCLYYEATSRGSNQDYNYVEYFNGTRYNSNQVMSNGPSGACLYTDA